MTAQTNDGEVIGPQMENIEATTGVSITTVTADAAYAYAKANGALQRRGTDALIPAEAQPIKSRVPLRRFRYDAEHEILKCPKGVSCGRSDPSNTTASSTRRLRTAPGVRSRAIADRRGASTRPSCWR